MNRNLNLDLQVGPADVRLDDRAGVFRPKNSHHDGLQLGEVFSLSQEHLEVAAAFCRSGQPHSCTLQYQVKVVQGHQQLLFKISGIQSFAALDGGCPGNKYPFPALGIGKAAGPGKCRRTRPVIPWILVGWNLVGILPMGGRCHTRKENHRQKAAFAARR